MNVIESKPVHLIPTQEYLHVAQYQAVDIAGKPPVILHYRSCYVYLEWWADPNRLTGGPKWTTCWSG